MNINQEGFDRRLAVVRDLVQQHGLKSKEVTPLAYVENCPFHFNNFIYRVELASAATCATFSGQQPCTTAAPLDGVSTIVVRLSNPLAEGLNNANRVENEVAAQFLARQSLMAAGMEPVVPAVYAWAPCQYPRVNGEAGFGWVLGEFKLGEDLDGQFPELSLEDASDVVEQLAAYFVVLQGTSLPSTVTGFGGLTITADGKIVSGQMAVLRGGPWESYAEVWAARLRAQLKEATESSLIMGWTNGGLRGQIDSFIDNGGITGMLKDVDVMARVLVHGDLTMNNMLYDKTTKRITAILDFDWSCITHPSEEFLTGLWDVGGGLSDRVGKLLPNILTGDFSMPPSDGAPEEEVRAWETAKAWDMALTKKGAIRPGSITGIRQVLALSGFEQLLCPFDLASEVMLKRRSDEDNAKRLADIEGKIGEWLKEHGYGA